MSRLEKGLAAALGQAEELRAASRRPLANPAVVEAAPLDDPLRGDPPLLLPAPAGSQ